MPQFLRTATPMGKWASFKFPVTQSGGVTNGLLILVHDTVAVTFFGESLFDAQGNLLVPQQIDVGGLCVGIYNAEKIRLPKEIGSGTGFEVGDKVFFSGVYADPVTNTRQSGYYWIGICQQAADDDDGYVMVDFKGDKATQLE